MLVQIQEGFDNTCYVRSNPKRFWRHLLCQIHLQRVLETLVMLGPIPKVLGDTCYVRSNLRGFGRHLLCQVQSQSSLEALVMLVPIPEGLGDPCYVRSISGDICYPRSSFGDVCQLRMTLKWLGYSRSERYCYLSPNDLLVFISWLS